MAGSNSYAANIDGVGADLQHSITSQIGETENRLTFGTGFRVDRVDYLDYVQKAKGAVTAGKKVDEFSQPLYSSVYVEDEWTPVKPLSLTLGGRYDRADYDRTNNLTGVSSSSDVDAFSPKLGAVYRMTDNLALYGNVGKAFMPASVMQLYTSKYANPNLSAEEALNYELGFRGKALDNRFSWQLAAFLMDVENEIFLQGVGAGQKYQNAGKSRHMGLELNTSFDLTKDVTLFANGTLQKVTFTEYADAAGNYKGMYLPETPRESCVFGAKWKLPKNFMLTVEGNYVGDSFADVKNTVEIPDRITWNTRLEYTVTVRKVELGWYVGVNNLLDEAYYAHRSSSGSIYPGMPRTYVGGMSMKF